MKLGAPDPRRDGDGTTLSHATARLEIDNLLSALRLDAGAAFNRDAA